jgi:hypothetical protein
LAHTFRDQYSKKVGWNWTPSGNANTPPDDNKWGWSTMRGCMLIDLTDIAENLTKKSAYDPLTMAKTTGKRVEAINMISRAVKSAFGSQFSIDTRENRIALIQHIIDTPNPEIPAPTRRPQTAPLSTLARRSSQALTGRSLSQRDLDQIAPMTIETKLHQLSRNDIIKLKNDDQFLIFQQFLSDLVIITPPSTIPSQISSFTREHIFQISEPAIVFTTTTAPTRRIMVVPDDTVIKLDT